MGDQAQTPKKGAGVKTVPAAKKSPAPNSGARAGEAVSPTDASQSRPVARPKVTPEELEAKASELLTEGADDGAEPLSGEVEIPADIAALPPPPLDPAVLAVPAPSKNMTRKELTEQYQPYVRSIAGKIKKTLSKDIEFDDLVSYGMLGLFEASDRYDAKYGANFMTFAYYRIRGAIYDGLRGMGWVSRTEYQRYRFEMQANAYLSNVSDTAAATSPTVAKKTTDDEVGELADVVSGLVTIYVTALDAMEGFQIKDDRGPSVDESLEVMQARKLVAEAVAKLPEQEKTLLQLYYYKEMSLEDVGKQLGLSKSWTSRLHTRAIEKLSRLLRDLVSEYQDSGTGKSVPAGGRVPPGGILTQPRGPTTR